MITLIRELFQYERVSFKSWLAKETFSKLIVALMFAVIVIGISVLLFIFSLGFFKYLLSFDSFGQMTSIYIVKASLLVVVWLGIISSIISSMSFLLTQDKRIDYLFTLPSDLRGLVVYQNFKTLAFNISIYLVLILPFALAYLISNGTNIFDTTLRSIFIIIIISLISGSLGSSVGYIVSNRFKKNDGYLFVFASIFIVLALTFSLFQIILPSQLRNLYSSVSSDFPLLFSQLPLNQNCLIINNIASVLTSGFTVSGLTVFLFSIFLSIFSYQIQISLFKETWQQSRVNIERVAISNKNTLFSFRFPSLLQKDLLSVFRSPREMGYGIFLFILLVVFAGLFSRGIEVNRIPKIFSSSMLIFSWLWLSFYSITYFMRICFPLMSKEGKARWWLFTQPISSYRIQNTKLLASSVFAIPIVIIGTLEWWLLPFPKSILFMSVFSFLSISTMLITITLLGVIKPDYFLSEEPEKVSTGVSGLLSLLLSLGQGGFSGYLIYLVSNYSISYLSAIFVQFAILIIFSIPLYLLGLKELRRHTLEV